MRAQISFVQPSLFSGMTVTDRFLEFHESNPQVYRELVSRARALQRAGHDHIGIGMLFEVLRYKSMIKTSDPSGFKLNNDYRSRYARLIMDRESDLRGFFHTRTLSAT